jgi:chromosome segregation ATPase
MNRLAGWVALASCFGAAALSELAVAQTARGGSASAQLVQQVQQLASERTTLQAENDKLKSQLAALTKDRDALKAGQQATDRRTRDASAALAHSNTLREATEQELTQTKARMQELIGKFRETIAQLRASESDGTTAKQALAARERQLSSCIDHNLSLYRLNDEVLTHYEKQGVFNRVAQAEPFTKIKRVQNENYIDEYRGRAQDQLLPPAALPHGAGAEQKASTPPSGQ